MEKNSEQQDTGAPFCNFQSMKSPMKLNNLLLRYFCCINWFDKSDTGGLANEDYLLNPIVSSWLH